MAHIIKSVVARLHLYSTRRKPQGSLYDVLVFDDYHVDWCLWHGADWKFVFWGMGHGLLLILHKLLYPQKAASNKFLKFSGALLTFHLVAVLWIFFRSTSIEASFESIRKIITENNFREIIAFGLARPEVLILIFLAALITFTPNFFKQKIFSNCLMLPLYLWPFIIIVLLQLIIQFRDNTIQPFIYFQF